MEFHITRGAREKYQFDDLLFSYNGNVIFANFQASRKFAHLMNQQRSDPTDVKTYIAPGQICLCQQANRCGIPCGKHGRCAEC